MSLLQRLNERNINQYKNSKNDDVKEKNVQSKLQDHLLQELKNTDTTDKDILNKIDEYSEDFLKEEGERLTFEAKKHLIDIVKNDLIGYGPITPFLNDDTITEIWVNGPDSIYVEQNSKKVKTGVSFRDEAHLMQVIEKIVLPLGRRIDESSPRVDARLPDGSRVNAIIPPISLSGPALSIRKFPKKRLTIDDLLKYGSLNESMAEFLEACVKAKLNIFISGGTSSGKTTLLNVLSNFIPSEDRIVTIEDAAELQLAQEHIVRLEARPPNIEGKGAVTIRDLLNNALRMTPDRIVIGEVRGGEAIDMLSAMNTGHSGNLSTGHSNSPRDMITRLETMVLMSGLDLPVRAIRQMIAGALNIIVHQSKEKDGTRKITHITEIIGMEGDTIILQDLFRFKQHRINEKGQIEGEFVSTGVRPFCSETLENHGIVINPNWFKEVS